MIRLLLLLVQIGVVVAVTAWLASDPGAVTLEWRGWRVDTSASVLAVALLGIALLLALLFRLWGALLALPGRTGRRLDIRRRRKGYRAFSQGLTALAGGDGDNARRLARRAEALLDDPALTRLLTAQAAQLAGDEAAAERAYRQMLADPETEFLGLRGLLIQAERRGDGAAALTFAERAYALQPKAPWAWSALLDLLIRAGRWSEALAVLDAGLKRRLIEHEPGKAQRATLLLALSAEADAEGRTEAARSHAVQAADARPGLPAATAQAARLLAAAGRAGKAAGVVENGWGEAPHPALAEIYDGLKPERNPIARFKALDRLTAGTADHAESLVATGRAALSARLWGEARRRLMRAAERAPAPRVYRLLAELEEAEHGDAAAARVWLDRAALAPPDPAWTCSACGTTAEDWAPRCGHCGSFDTLHWAAPRFLTAAAGTAEASAHRIAAIPRPTDHPSPAATPAPGPGVHGTAPRRPGSDPATPPRPD